MPTITPTLKSKVLFNELDSIGLLVGVERLPEESNFELKRRILNANFEKGGPHYRGLVNAINRELGTQIFDAMTITVLSGSPSVEFKEGVFTIWTDNTRSTIELQVNVDQKLNNVYLLRTLQSHVSNSQSLIALGVEAGREDERSGGLINFSTSKFVREEEVLSSRKVSLSKENLIQGSLTFNDILVFRREVASGQVSKAGDYYVDYSAGTIEFFQEPPAGVRVGYQWEDFDLMIEGSPIVLRNISAEGIGSLMYTANEAGENSVLNEFGEEVINELLSVAPTYWGK